MTVRAWMGRLMLLLGLSAGWSVSAPAQQPSGRVALVIGNGAYPGQAALPTAANDAGLVAQTLTAAGFDVTGARDLDGDGLRRALREFLDKASAAGPGGIAFVYLSGHALQFDGENFFVPVDASLARDSDIPLQAIRVTDFTHALTGLPLQARLVVVDGAYADPLVPPSDHIAAGLALADAEAGSLIAFNAAPGTVAPTPTGSYGVYGQALAEMMRQGGVPADEVFDRVRLRVNETTRGAVVPWDSARLDTPFTFLDQAPDAPAAVNAQQSFAGMSKRPIREFPADEAYSLAVARDTFPAYQDFLAAYPQSPNARRVRALLALRREALIWRQTVGRNSSAAYWSYLRRYPKGPHVYDCRRRLAMIAAPLEPPDSFAPIDYDVPPPPAVEYELIERPTIDFDEPPPPPPPVYFLPPEQPDFIDLPPPPPSIAPGFLPIPVPVPVPFGRPSRRPGFIEPPRGFQGGYAQPQPFVTDPGGRLIPQPGPQRAGPAAPFPPGQRGSSPPPASQPGEAGGRSPFAPPGPRQPIGAGRPGGSFGQAPPRPFGPQGTGQAPPGQQGGPAANPAAAEEQRQRQDQQRLQQQRVQQQQFQQRQQQDQQQRAQQQQFQQRQQREQQQRVQQQQQRAQQQQFQQQRVQQQHQQQEQQQRVQQQQFQQRQQQEQQQRVQQQQFQQREQQQRAQQQQLQQRQQQEQQQRVQQQQRFQPQGRPDCGRPGQPPCR